MNKLYTHIDIKVYDRGEFHSKNDVIVYEQYVDVILNGHYLTSLACSPAAVKELGTGYLLNQRLISTYEEIRSIVYDEKETLWIETNQKERHVEGCRPASALRPAELLQQYETAKLSGVKLTPSVVLSLVDDLDRKAATFHLTGGVHSVALADTKSIIVRYEDIGRHNALDKVVGHALHNKIPLNDKCVILSGRIASEMFLKAAANRIPVIISRSAPTLLTVEWAQKIGMTIIGFARGQRFNVYTGWEHIVL